MAAWMARAGADLLDEADVVVPVPLHRRRLWWRRFNQSALLAQHCRPTAGKPLATDALARIRATRAAGRPDGRASATAMCAAPSG